MIESNRSGGSMSSGEGTVENQGTGAGGELMVALISGLSSGIGFAMSMSTSAALYRMMDASDPVKSEIFVAGMASGGFLGVFGATFLFSVAFMIRFFRHR
ncbi:hypothetical protein HON52_04830 [Candidatus Uhrbacteria bacterium]|jgi:hypothetical protein|nr:hypothetical protein [Candidatus Uhrbacteria bacterium]